MKKTFLSKKIFWVEAGLLLLEIGILFSLNYLGNAISFFIPKEGVSFWEILIPIWMYLLYLLVTSKSIQMVVCRILRVSQIVILFFSVFIGLFLPQIGVPLGVISILIYNHFLSFELKKHALNGKEIILVILSAIYSIFLLTVFFMANWGQL